MMDRDKMIWEYIDGILDSNEVAMVEKLLKEDSEFKGIYEEAKLVHKELEEQTLDVPSMAFTSKLMAKLSTVKIEALHFSYKRFFGILFFAMFCAVALNQFYVFESSTGILDKVNFNNYINIEAVKMDWFPSSSIYALIVGSLLCLYWIDQFYTKRFSKFQ